MPFDQWWSENESIQRAGKNNLSKISIKVPWEKTNCKEQAMQMLAMFPNADDASKTTHLWKEFVSAG